MRANDIIRNVIDLIDQIDGGRTPSVSIAINSTPIEPPEPVNPIAIATAVEPNVIDKEEEFAGDDVRRFKQIVNLLNPQSIAKFSNTPNEQYADIESVTTDAGGGVNNPKHPSDQRVQHPSLYPTSQWKGE